MWLWKFINQKKLNYIGFGGFGNQIRDVIHVYDVCELILEQIKKIKKINNKIFNAGGSVRNSISLRQLTEKVTKITRKDIPIGRIAKTSNYDIPYYVTSNKKIYSFYKWRVKRNLDTIIKDTYDVLVNNKKIFIKNSKKL